MTMMLFIYVFVNVGMVTGILPVVRAAALHELRRDGAVHHGHRVRHHDEHQPASVGEVLVCRPADSSHEIHLAAMASQILANP